MHRTIWIRACYALDQTHDLPRVLRVVAIQNVVLAELPLDKHRWSILAEAGRLGDEVRPANRSNICHGMTLRIRPHTRLDARLIDLFHIPKLLLLVHFDRVLFGSTLDRRQSFGREALPGAFRLLFKW